VNVLIDENLPRFLKGALPGHSVETVQGAGWSGIKNGALLSLAEPVFDVFITADRNLRYQQNLAGRKISIVELPTNRLSEVEKLVPELLGVLTRIKSGEYVEMVTD
jgi:hypothetical protein